MARQAIEGETGRAGGARCMGQRTSAEETGQRAGQEQGHADPSCPLDPPFPLLTSEDLGPLQLIGCNGK
jgi:hypothetical protein